VEFDEDWAKEPPAEAAEAASEGQAAPEPTEAAQAS